MTESRKQAWSFVSWGVALSIGVIGMYGASQKAISDAAAKAHLAETKAALLISESNNYRADINESYRALNALRDYVNRGHAVLDERGHVVEWSKPLERWTGYAAEEMIGKDLGMVMDAKSMQAHRRGYDAAIVDKNCLDKTVRLTCNLLHKDGSQMPVVVTARMHRLSNGHLRTLAFVNLASDTVETEEQEGNGHG